MWKRDLLFWGLVLIGIGFLGQEFLPSSAPDANAQLRPARPESNQKPVDPAAVSQSVARLDEILEVSWQDAGLAVAQPVDGMRLARRLSLTLAGTVPSLEEIRQLEAIEEDRRLEAWLDYLLVDRRTADYLAERFARAYVGTEAGPFLVYRRRRFVTWLADQFAVDRPYDELVREMLTADGLWTDTPGTNFFTLDLLPKETGFDEPEVTSRFARAFLGIRMDCARCHDHPFAEWSQQDFHHLAAYFGQLQHTFIGLNDGDEDYTVDLHQTGDEELVETGVPFAEEALPGNGTRRAQLAAWLTDEANVAFPRSVVNRIWALMFGRPLVEPVDDIPIEQGVEPLLDYLAADFVAHDYRLSHLIRVIAGSRAYQVDSRIETTEDAEGDDASFGDLWSVFPVTRLRPEQVASAVVQASSLRTRDYQDHILFRIARTFETTNFVQRYGDAGELELEPEAQTIPQRLLLLNGQLVKQKAAVENMAVNASARIAALAPDDASRIEIAFLTVLTREPSEGELAHFIARFSEVEESRKGELLEDLFVTLFNSTEFLCLN